MTNKTLLICVDGSDIAEAAFNYAIEQIYKKGDIVLLLTVPEYDISLAALGSDWEKVLETVKKNDSAIETLYAKYVNVLRQNDISGKGLKPQGGKAGEVICNTARSEGATHIVMGTRGLGKIQRAILGSVSNYVLNHADIPVTIIPKNKNPVQKSN